MKLLTNLDDPLSSKLLMAPIPMEAGRLKFKLTRNKDNLNLLHPVFTLYLVKPDSYELYTLLFAKKRPLNKTANFLISKAKLKHSRSSAHALGKLRGLSESRTDYILYDTGENPSQYTRVPLHEVRNEHLAVTYWEEEDGKGVVARKCKVIMPGVEHLNTGETYVK